MELLLRNGKYVLANDGGALDRVSGGSETAQRIMMKLCARRGGFPLRPDFGSRLYLLHREKPSAKAAAARRYIAEALAGEDAVLEKLELLDADDGTELRMTLSVGGGELTLTTAV